MNFFLRILFPRLSRALKDLAKTAGLTQPKAKTNIMTRFTTTEEIQLFEGLKSLITDLKQTNADLRTAVAAAGPALEENAALKAALEKAEAEDAASDAALASLADLLPKAPAENPPVVEPEPETPATPEGVDPIDPPADPAEPNTES